LLVQSERFSLYGQNTAPLHENKIAVCPKVADLIAGMT
jgi:hypothetical protein